VQHHELGAGDRLRQRRSIAGDRIAVADRNESWHGDRREIIGGHGTDRPAPAGGERLIACSGVENLCDERGGKMEQKGFESSSDEFLTIFVFG